MDRASAYIPMDWRQAMARGGTLPERMEGAALFADISGFTPLTEALALELGPKRGAEELTVHLNRVYDALIAELHRYGGSVIGFAGDAITCWLDGDDGRRATACGLAMQQVMQQFAEVETFSGRIVSLGMKAAVAAGPVRRFLVGDPDYAIVDAMAGKTLEHMAAAEHQAERGDVILHSSAAEPLAEILKIAEWRVDEQTGERFAAVTGMTLAVPYSAWPDLADDTLTEEQKRAWLLPPVYQRLQSGRGEFLAELRPGVALFLRFSGIHYDEDEQAPQKLDTFIREVGRILTRYDGSLIQLTIGDKGSYLYAAFGAPIAHEDDAVRAASTALDLQELASRLEFLDEVQVGITQGRMRTGAYGSVSRRTYGVLGDATNLSARLMAAAKPGQILASEVVREATGETFRWESMPNIRVKGKSEPVTLARLVRVRRAATFQLREPKYHLPMVGRAEELALIEQKIEQALRGRGQIVGITAEAGMGKSRLAAEVVRLALDQGLETYGGECQSFGTNTSYLVWQPIWRGFFGLDPAWSVEEQVATLETQLARIDQALVPRLPLLGVVLGISIPDSDLTRTFDAKLRKTSLESLLVDCLKARARTSSLLFVLEDCHWLDPLSHNLIEVIGRAIANLPALLLLDYRPPDLRRLQAPRVDKMAHFSEIVLADFTPGEAERLIGLKLQQFFGADTDIPADFVKEVTRRAAGNPFYIEEILNYLKDLGVDPHDTERLATLDLPTSIYSLILSRVDQLNDHQQITLKVASVIGRLFRAAMVWGVYPELGELGNVQQDLQVLSDLELTSLDAPEPEFVYLFKHVLTQEVAYESLPYATRASLHEQIGAYIERTYTDTLEQYVDLLAYHYGRSENQDKKRTYLRQAGEAAQASYANAAAIDYFQRLLPLLNLDEQGAVLLELGRVLDTVGEYHEAESRLREGLDLAQSQNDRGLQARFEVAIGELYRKQSVYDEAADFYSRALNLAEQIGDQAAMAKALVCAGSLALYQGHYAEASAYYEQSLAIRRALDDQLNVANILNNMAISTANRGDLVAARSLFEESLAIRRTLQDRWLVANSLNNLGQLAYDLGAYDMAYTYLEEAVTIQRETGDKWMLGNALVNLGNALRALGKYEEAYGLYEESLEINRDLGDRWMLSYLLENIGSLMSLRGEPARSLNLAGAASALRELIGTPLSPTEKEQLDLSLEPARQALGASEATAAWQAGRDLDLEWAIELALQAPVSGSSASSNFHA